MKLTDETTLEPAAGSAAGILPLPHATAPHPGAVARWGQALTGALDDTYAVLKSFHRERAKDSITRLALALNACRVTSMWKELIQQVIRTHPAFSLFQQDPFTRRAFHKPRGYPGDPELLDLAFGHSASMLERQSASAIGKFVSGYSIQGTAARAVRERLGILSTAIDDTAHRVPQARILALACGHARELESSVAFQERRLARFVAMDHDVQTVQRLRSAYSGGEFEVWQAGPRDLLQAGDREGFGTGFHFIYTAGLFDYLSERYAGRLLSAMFRRLVPGGRLLFGNFTPDLSSSGYMEGFMDWWLTYRTPVQLIQLTATIDSREISALRTFADSSGALAFLEITRH